MHLFCTESMLPTRQDILRAELTPEADAKSMALPPDVKKEAKPVKAATTNLRRVAC